MIAMATVLSTMLTRAGHRGRHAAGGCGRRVLLLGAAAALPGCVSESTLPGPPAYRPKLDDDAFVMPDGARLPLRIWLPDGVPNGVILALHGFNDSRDGFEIPAPSFTAAGFALYAPDQRGFGEAPGRGLWPGVDGLVDDAETMVKLLAAAHPDQRLFVMGESMGAAVLMCLADRNPSLPVAGYILAAPAVWGRARMNVFLRSALWLAANLAPGMEVSRPPPTVQVIASDNHDALIRLSRDPLTIRSTRFDTLRGLVDLMDAALAAAPVFTPPGLFLYGAHDQLVPKEATDATWAALPPGHRLAYYPQGWHLLLRDLDRAKPIGDAIAWMHDPAAPLPSAADRAAVAWLASES
jgi:alpha-beta hydrolase superfamily lysophospholipase